jgi:hypothetical protein
MSADLELTDAQVLQILGIGRSCNIIEALGYEYSTRGKQEFRRARPRFVSTVIEHIKSRLQTFAGFPSEDCALLSTRPDGTVQTPVAFEVGVGKYVDDMLIFPCSRTAAVWFAWASIDPQYWHEDELALLAIVQKEFPGAHWICPITGR